jgi:hypothetical protein
MTEFPGTFGNSRSGPLGGVDKSCDASGLDNDGDGVCLEERFSLDQFE